LSSKTEESLSAKLLTCREFHFGQIGSFEEESEQASVCCKIHAQLETDPDFFSKIITGDKTVYGYDPETKQGLSQSTSPWSPCGQKARQVCSNVKRLLMVFSAFTELCIMNLF
jgi:hypothetical protein